MLKRLAPGATGLPLQSVSVTIQANDAVTCYTLGLVYKSDSKNPIEANITFPTNETWALRKVTTQVADRVLESKIVAKEKVKEKYDDDISRSRLASFVNYDDDRKDCLQMTIGNIAPKETVKINYEFVGVNQVDGNAYYFGLPNQILEMIIPVKSTRRCKRRCNCFPRYHIINYYKEYTHTPTTIKFEVSTSTKINKASLYIDNTKDKLLELEEPSESWSDELETVATSIGFILRWQPSGKEGSSILVEKNPSGKRLSALASYPLQFPNVEPLFTRGEFVLLLDRSKSMGGKRLQLAIEASILFLKSLPSESIFNIISFGGSFEPMFTESVKNSDENIEKAVATLSEFKANMGGTDIFSPLHHLFSFKTKNKSPVPRFVFLLTDGAVENPGAVLSLVSLQKASNRVFSMGIGEQVSEKLVQEAADRGRGKALFIQEPKEIPAAIVGILEDAIKPCATNIQAWWLDTEGNPIKEAKLPDGIGQFGYPDEIIRVLDDVTELKDLSGMKVAYELLNADIEETDFDEVVSFTKSDLIDGHDLACLVAREEIRCLEKEAKVDEATIVAKSKQNSVLSNYTSFYMVCKDQRKFSSEVKSVNLTIVTPIQNGVLVQNRRTQMKKSKTASRSPAQAMKRKRVVENPTKKCKSSKRVSPETPVSMPKFSGHMEWLSKQSSSGCWTWERISNLCKVSKSIIGDLIAKVKDILKDSDSACLQKKIEEKVPDIVSTIIAMQQLQALFPKQRDQWHLCYQKAKMFSTKVVGRSKWPQIYRLVEQKLA